MVYILVNLGDVILHFHEASPTEMEYISKEIMKVAHAEVSETPFKNPSKFHLTLPSIKEDKNEFLLGDIDEVNLLISKSESPKNNRFLLTKNGKITNRIFKRWCELTENKELRYFKEPYDTKPLGTVALEGSIVRTYQRPYKLCHEKSDPPKGLFIKKRPVICRFCLEVHIPTREYGPLVIHCHGNSSDLRGKQLSRALNFASEIDQDYGKDLNKDFKLLKMIGQGGFASVYLVRKNDNGKLYAMKTIQKQNVSTERQINQTFTERYILQEIDHPFVLKLHWAFTSNSKLYFVMDYCSGGELFFHLKKYGNFNEEAAIFYISEISLALEAVHEHGVIYRDLKPENILLDEEGHIRLADFGLSKKVNTLGEQATTFCGSADYLAPEIVNHKAYGMEVDWWSLGCLFYELLCGVTPFFSGKNKPELYSKISSGKISFPNDFSKESRVFIQNLLTVDSKCRLGAGPNGMNDIKNHKVFLKHDIEWNSVLKRRLTPPVIPEIRSVMDTHNFDPFFTARSIDTTISTDSHRSEDTFKGFSYRTGSDGVS